MQDEQVVGGHRASVMHPCAASHRLIYGFPRVIRTGWKGLRHGALCLIEDSHGIGSGFMATTFAKGPFRGHSCNLRPSKTPVVPTRLSAP